MASAANIELSCEFPSIESALADIDFDSDSTKISVFED